jgi:hypothetical protein
MFDVTKSGNDHLIGGSNSGSGAALNRMGGDGHTMADAAQGGNDILFGGDNFGNFASGFVNNLLLPRQSVARSA